MAVVTLRDTTSNLPNQSSISTSVGHGFPKPTGSMGTGLGGAGVGAPCVDLSDTRPLWAGLAGVVRSFVLISNIYGIQLYS